MMLEGLQQYGNEDIKQSDILIGKGKKYTDHVGTIAFKAFIGLHVAEYMNEVTGSSDRALMTGEIVDIVKSHGGRFLKETRFDSGVWVEINQKDAREKVRYSFRDAIESQRKERPRALLTKVQISVDIHKEDSFGEILNKLSSDPAVHRFLATSKKNLKGRKARNKRRESKIVAAKRPRKSRCLSLPRVTSDDDFQDEEPPSLDSTCQEFEDMTPLRAHLCEHSTEYPKQVSSSPLQRQDDLPFIDPWKEDGFESYGADMCDELLQVLQQPDHKAPDSVSCSNTVARSKLEEEHEEKWLRKLVEKLDRGDVEMGWESRLMIPV